MSTFRNQSTSEYMVWAKTRSQSRYNLATSGVRHFPIRDLGVNLEDIELSGPSGYGYEPLQQALAAKCNVSPECVVASVGTSLANHLAMAAVVEPGDEVLIEHPAYEPILALARYLGAEIKRFRRRFEDGFGIDSEEVRRQVTPRTRLIVVTNLHNPSSVLIEETSLRQLGEIARRVGAHVLVDEVYLEAIFPEKSLRQGGDSGSRTTPRNAFHLGNEFIVTSSLTKVYGLSGLRCGWILAEPELARRVWRLTDLFHNIPTHSAERLSVVALERLEKIAERARVLLETNRTLLFRFLDKRSDLEVIRPPHGTVIFPRLKQGTSDNLCTTLQDRYETTVVPGRFFEMPDHFRLGIGGDTDTLAAGLERLGAALDECGARA
ncbi:MAG: aminotransferase class I/II-fold pyridoxal phosphate-dependent enzyme [Acidobacteriia bacterium]|nr:aminotransferase class I/II-fold pyridoxal phosphate-dependent enzyme [Terriglobia bacterium]